MATTSFLLDEFTGSDAQVRVTLTDQAAGTVRVKLEVVSTTTGNIGDLVGFFVNLNSFTVNNNFTISPVSATPGNPLTVGPTTGFGTLFLDDSGSTTDNLEAVDSNVNLDGEGQQRSYQLAVQFGKGGLNGTADDYRTVEFDLSATGLDISDFSKVGVRLQSVGTNREGSSKLEGNVPPAFQPFNISGTKYLDKTGNGITNDDTGLGGVTIFIDKNSNGTFDDGTDLSATTASDGTWSFSNLGSDFLGKKVYEVLPSGYTQTVGQNGYTLPSEGGQDQTNLNFANFKLFNISGTKYLDKTGNGITNDDTGLGGVTIFIDKNSNGTFDDGTDVSATTASDGTWSFSNLGADVLGKKVYEVLPSGYTQTVGKDGYTLPSEGGQDQTNLNFANFKLFNISGTKYLDKTANGITTDDGRLGGVTIFIDKNGNGTFDSGTDVSTTTASDGTWSFSNLGSDVLGKKVFEVVPSGYIQTVGNAGYTLPSEGGSDQTNLNFANFKPEGPGVGTPGFWKQWTAVWDGNTSNDGTFNTKANFPKKDILYTVTDPVTGTNTQNGILIGDFDRDGLTSGNEKTIFYTVAEAQAILNSSASNDGQDARYILDKQLIASWLNVVAGNSYDTGIGSIKQDIINGVRWLQKYTPNEGGTSEGDGSLTVSASTYRVPSSSAAWSGSGYGDDIKDVLDYYNNYGAGFAIDRDTGLVGGSTTQLATLQAYQPSFVI